MFQALGTQMHPYMETIVPTLLQICGSTKRQNQINGGTTVATVIQHAGYNSRLLIHICATFNDRRKEARVNAPGWLTQFLQCNSRSLDPVKDYPMIEKSLVLGLNDGDVKTRENTRETFWQYSKTNETATNAVIDTLNNHAANALRSDKHNPNKTAGPAKPARPGSALAQIKAQKLKAATAQPPPEAKRDFSNSSSLSQPPISAHERFQAPSGRSTPEDALDPRRRHDAEHKTTLKSSVRSERNGMQESRSEHGVKKATRPHTADARETKQAETHPTESDPSSARPFLSAPVRRPRVVATPISQPQPAPRPTSKGEPAKRPEVKEKAPIGRSGRQTPVMVEDTVPDSQQKRPNQAHKSSASKDHKFAPNSSASSRPGSSSSEPSGIRSPRGHTQQASSVNVLPTRHQKSFSTSEAKHHPSVPSFAQPVQPPKPKIRSPPTKEVPLFSEAPRTPQIIEPAFEEQVQPPPAPVILPSPAKENTSGLQQGKAAMDEALIKAKRSLPSIIDALHTGKLDALGYRKLRKLIVTYPGQLFNSSGTDDQYDLLYNVLISQASLIEDTSEPYEHKRANLNHPMYTRMAVIDMLQLLISHYPYGEPTPGMTLLALLVAKASYDDTRVQVDDKIRSSMQVFLKELTERFHPLPVIDTLTAAILELSNVMNTENDTSTDQQGMPTWNATLSFAPNAPPFPITIFFTTSPNAKSALETGIHVLSQLVRGANIHGHHLSESQQERLAELLTDMTTNYKHLFKRQVMEFATVLFEVIKPEERFRALFKDEGDLNLVWYCIGKGNNEGARGRAKTVPGAGGIRRQERIVHDEF